MANKDNQERLGATDSGPRPGRFPLGSPQSRAAARAMLAARESEAEFRVQTVSVVDGKPVCLDGLAETIRAARMRIDTEEEAGSSPAIIQNSNGGRRADCLEERMRRARERVASWQDKNSLH